MYIAQAIATIAHRGQLDKAGLPYITHPQRVVSYLFNPRDQEVAAAWLHDVLEDTDLTREDLHEAGIDWPTIGIVEFLTHTPGQRLEDYYADIRASYTARRVKLADIADNTDPNRLAKLDAETIVRLTKKYAKARLLLNASPTDRESNDE